MKTRKRRLFQRDSILKRLGQRQKGVVMPDGETIWQAGGERVETSGQEASATFTLVTRGAEPNRHGNKVLIVGDERGRGMIPDNFERVPVVLFEHGLNPNFSAPIGASRKDKDAPAEFKLTKTKATGKVYFDQGSAAAMDIFRMVDAGLLNMASIGFRPTLAEALGRKTRKLPDGVEDLTRYYGGMDFVESDWWEWSIVAIGADPGALRQTYDRRKIGGEKLHAAALEWLRSMGAEYQRVWFPAADIPDTSAGQIVKRFGVALQGEKVGEFLTAIDALAKPAEPEVETPAETAPEQPAATAVQNAETPVDPPVQNLTMPDLGEHLAIAYRDQTRSGEGINQVLSLLPTLVAGVVTQAVAPLKADVAKTEAELNRRIGQVA